MLLDERRTEGPSEAESIIDVAVRYARAGFRVEPMWRAGVKSVPCRRRYFEHASSDAGEAVAVFRDYPNALNVGVVLGACQAGNVFVIDIDVGHAGGADGCVEARVLFNAIGGRPHGPVTRTPRRGWHVWMSAPHGFAVANLSGPRSLRPGIDVRGYRSIVPVPPSRRRDGAYCSIVGLCEAPVPSAPDALLAMIERQPDRRLTPASAARCRRAEWEDRLAQRELDKAIVRLTRQEKPGRSTTLFHSAAWLGGFVAAERLSESEVAQHLRAAAIENGLVRENGLLDVERTIRRGLALGALEPRRLDRVVRHGAQR